MKTPCSKIFCCCLTAILVWFATLAPLTAKAATANPANSLTRIGGVDQYATSALMAQAGWPGTTDKVVLSSGINSTLVDALAAGPLAAKLKAPILLTDRGNSLNPFAKAELQRLKPTKVYITSGTAVIKPEVITELKEMGIIPVQLGGYDQYETSVNIAKELANQGVTFSRIILAAGWLCPADALSIAPIAAAQEIPILTTTQGQLPASVKTYLDSIKTTVTDSYVVGGSAVISETVLGLLPGKTTRYSGLTKYDTNLQILKNFARDYKNDQLYVASGETLVDALAGVPLAAASGAPLLLVSPKPEKAVENFVKLNLSTAEMVALGGEAVVTAEAMNTLTSSITYPTDEVTVGSSQADKPVKLTENLRISGNNLTLQNAEADYSIYVQGNNVTLSNLKVSGTVFLDPGDKGTATLNKVKATNIVILSGAKDSIHLIDTTAEVLTVDSRSEVRVESRGTTAIRNSVLRSWAILDVRGGSLGKVIITAMPGKNPPIELRGIFTQPVVITTKAQVHLSSSAVITDLVAQTGAELLVDQGAQVTNYDNRGNTVTITGSGAKGIPPSRPISLEESTLQPPIIPPTPTPPTIPTNPPNPTNPTQPESVTLSKLRVITDPANRLGIFNNGAEINLSGLDDKVSFLGFAVTADKDCTLQLKVLNDNRNISLTAGEEEVVTIGDLIFGGEIPEVFMEDLRMLYQDVKTKTLQGKLIIDGKSAGTLRVKLRFSN